MDPNQTTPRSAARQHERSARVLLSPQHRRLPHNNQQTLLPQPPLLANEPDPFVVTVSAASNMIQTFPTHLPLPHSHMPPLSHAAPGSTMTLDQIRAQASAANQIIAQT